MKNSLNVYSTSVKSLIIVFCLGIASCEESAQSTKLSTGIKEPITVINGTRTPELGEALGTTTCRTEEDRKTCDLNNDGICECDGAECGSYCHNQSLIYQFLDRGRICPTAAGCMPSLLSKLKIYFRATKLDEVSSTIVTKDNEVFAKHYIVSYDEKAQRAVVGYQIVNAELSKSSLFVQINTNYINYEGKFVSLNMISEEIPANHFQTK